MTYIDEFISIIKAVLPKKNKIVVIVSVRGTNE